MTEYKASGGTEVFLSLEHLSTDSLVAYLRLREPSQEAHRKEMAGSSVIREVKVFGRMVGIGKRDSSDWQHKGYGEVLVKEAERITSEEFDRKNILVTSGIGVRDYYRKHGYERIGPYMGKTLG
jgi:elongator complex protein 3